MKYLQNFGDKYVKNRGHLIVSLIVGCSIHIKAHAVDLPVVNLGSTTFYDGAEVPGGKGWSASLFYQNYRGRKITDNKGHEIGLPKSSTNIDSVLMQLIYQGSGGPHDSDWGFSAVLPVVTKNLVDDGLNNTVLDGSEGLADLNIGFYLQFKPIMGDEGPRFVHRLEADVIAPVGDYKKHTAINPGANFWSFNPYWAATFWASSKTTISWRLHYLWNAKNDAPSPETYGDGVDDVQAGQAVHLNFNTLYAFTPKFSAGVNGYWLNQFTDTKIDGDSVSGRREKVFAIGPGAMFAFSRQDVVIANLYFESEARNRPEGNRFVMRWVHKL
ncbi:transporter [Pseudomonas sp. MSSRFD41]|uniref:SphA family protein n=1 Tax=Pseudomonas sp. MSSRFD41 TaxID=1310370 RepID=UPI00289CC681|nr:transporter [Pseudomonas sp. MSSRFD41]